MDKALLELGSAAESLSRYIAEQKNQADPKIIRAQVELIAYRAETVTGTNLLAK